MDIGILIHAAPKIFDRHTESHRFMNKMIAALAVAAAAIYTPCAVQAQVPADIAAKLREIGAVSDPQKTAPLYQPLHGDKPYQGIHVQTDLKYGPDERHLLDMATPREEDAKPRPVLIFVHGGGFTRGDRITTGPFNGNVMTWAVKNGFVGISMTYRLAPKHIWPAGRDDVATVIAFARRNIEKHGGDPNRIYVMGHSAGAIHLAHYVAMAAEKNEKNIAGAIMVSGLYSLNESNVTAAEKLYFGESAKNYAEGSSLRSLPKAAFPLMLAYGELDIPLFVTQSELANKTLCDAGKCPRLVQLKDHAHISEIYAVGTPDVSLTKEILAFTGMTK